MGGGGLASYPILYHNMPLFPLSDHHRRGRGEFYRFCRFLCLTGLCFLSRTSSLSSAQDLGVGLVGVWLAEILLSSLSPSQGSHLYKLEIGSGTVMRAVPKVVAVIYGTNYGSGRINQYGFKVRLAGHDL